MVLDRLKRKFGTAARMMPPAIIEQRGPVRGRRGGDRSSDGAVREALDILKARGVGGELHAHSCFSVRPRGLGLLRQSTRSSSSSNRIATRSCVRS